MSKLQAAAETSAQGADAAHTQSSQPGVLRSLTFWLCLLLAAGGYGLATLAPSYVRNQQLRAEYVAADAELQRLVAQVDRYERYCERLIAGDGGGDGIHSDHSALAAPSPRPSPPQRPHMRRHIDRGGEGEETIAPLTGALGAVSVSGEFTLALQQIAVEESLQFQLEDLADTRAEAAVPSPSVSPVIALFNRSRVVRGVVRLFSAVLLLLAFTLCLDTPRRRTPAVAPRRDAGRFGHPLAWLGMRYRGVESVEHN